MRELLGLVVSVCFGFFFKGPLSVLSLSLSQFVWLLGKPRKLKKTRTWTHGLYFRYDSILGLSLLVIWFSPSFNPLFNYVNSGSRIALFLLKQSNKYLVISFSSDLVFPLLRWVSFVPSNHGWRIWVFLFFLFFDGWRWNINFSWYLNFCVIWNQNYYAKPCIWKQISDIRRSLLSCNWGNWVILF